jgi:hypothetical protein
LLQQIETYEARSNATPAQAAAETAVLSKITLNTLQHLAMRHTDVQQARPARSHSMKMLLQTAPNHSRLAMHPMQYKVHTMANHHNRHKL